MFTGTGGGGKLRVNTAGADSEAGSHQSHLSNHSSEDFDYDDDEDDGNYSEIPEPSGRCLKYKQK